MRIVKFLFGQEYIHIEEETRQWKWEDEKDANETVKGRGRDSGTFSVEKPSLRIHIDCGAVGAAGIAPLQNESYRETGGNRNHTDLCGVDLVYRFSCREENGEPKIFLGAVYGRNVFCCPCVDEPCVTADSGCIGELVLVDASHLWRRRNVRRNA